MKERFERFPNLDPRLNELLRKAFQSTDKDEIFLVEPTLATMSQGEKRVYYNGTDYIMYHKVSATEMGKSYLTKNVIKNRTSDPASPETGEMWIRTDL